MPSQIGQTIMATTISNFRHGLQIFCLCHSHYITLADGTLNPTWQYSLFYISDVNSKPSLRKPMLPNYVWKIFHQCSLALYWYFFLLLLPLQGHFIKDYNSLAKRALLHSNRNIIIIIHRWENIPSARNSSFSPLYFADIFLLFIIHVLLMNLGPGWVTSITVSCASRRFFFFSHNNKKKCQDKSII